MIMRTKPRRLNKGAMMKKRNRTTIYGLLLLGAMMLNLPSPAGAQESESTVQPQAKTFHLQQGDVTSLIASFGSLSNESMTKISNPVRGFHSPQDKVIWTVVVPKDDDYVVSVLFSMRNQVKMEVSSGKSVLTAPSSPCTWEDRPYFWRQVLPGTLRLKAGENQISFRLPEATPPTSPMVETRANKFGQAVQTDFHLFSIELGTAAARQGQVARAKELRGDASWMVDGKYGLFVHFSSMSYPFQGTERRAAWFQKSVEMFDVNVFADAVERTGAAWVTFTATHQGFYWPGSNAALDKIQPGRTTKRDLLGEIINELDRRGIRTLFYLHTGYNGYDPEVWREALGANDPDTTRLSDNIEAILRECSLRYGKKLMGFGYIDGALSWDSPLNPSWEGWARAIKAGNPKALVGLSSNRGPVVSPFTDLAVTDSGGGLTRPDPQLIGPGRQLGDVVPAAWCLMDTWYFTRPLNGKFPGGPHHSTADYVDYFQRMAAEKIPVTINLAMTADVVGDHPIFNPKCMEVMEAVRKAIRGQ